MQKPQKFHLLLIVLLIFNLQAFAQITEKLIGGRIWMTSNLNVSKFQNGDPIYEAKTKAQWNKASKDKKPAWCYYQNNAQNGVTYGKLYNWYAVNDPRGLAPKGWHIPTKSEWKELISNLQKDVKDVNEALKTKTGWKQYEVGGGEVGSDCIYCNGTGLHKSGRACWICGGTGGDRQYVKKRMVSGNGTNTSGFSAKPGANRFTSEDEEYDFNKNIGLVAIWWLPSEAKSPENAEYVYINNDDYTPTFDDYSKGYGSSVRLIKDKSKDVLEKERLLEEEKKVKDSTEKALKLIEDSIKNVEKIKKIIGKPIQLDGFMVAEFDIPSDFYLESRINFEDAKKACEKLGKGWRLPTKDDFVIIYKNRSKIGGFDMDKFYWTSTFYSSTESDEITNGKEVWQLSFSEASFKVRDKDDRGFFKVRPIWAPTSDFVRDSTRKALKRISDSLMIVEKEFQKEKIRLEDSVRIAKIIGQPIELKGLLVAEFDFSNEMNLNEASIACKNSGQGWRLPTEEELSLILDNRKKMNVTNFEFDKYYWCSGIFRYELSVYKYAKSIFINSNGKPKTFNTSDFDKLYKIRAVKTL